MPASGVLTARLVARVFDGAAQPVGGSAEGTLRLRSVAAVNRATRRKA